MVGEVSKLKENSDELSINQNILLAIELDPKEISKDGIENIIDFGKKVIKNTMPMLYKDYDSKTITLWLGMNEEIPEDLSLEGGLDESELEEFKLRAIETNYLVELFISYSQKINIES